MPISASPAIYQSPAWSPTGSRVVAIRGPAEAYREATGPQAPGAAADLVWFPATGGEATFIAPAGNRGSPISPGTRPGSGSPGVTEAMVSIRWDGTDERKHLKATGPVLLSQTDPSRAELILMAPRGDQALVQVGFDFWAVTVPQVGAEPPTVALAKPENASFPARRLTEGVGGEFPAWSADGRKVHWSIGNAHVVYDLDAAKAFDDSVKTAARDTTRAADSTAAKADTTRKKLYQPLEERIVVRATRDIPQGTVVLRGARVVTMRGDEVLEAGDVVVTNNRITAVGPTGQVAVPAGARVIELSGKTLVPGYVDVHAHMWPRWGIHWTQPWMYLANLAYGVTTTRDPPDWIERRHHLRRPGRRRIGAGPADLLHLNRRGLLARAAARSRPRAAGAELATATTTTRRRSRCT